MSRATSGVDGKVLANGTDMDVTGFSADIEDTEVDTTTTADAGWEDAIDGVHKISGTFDFYWNSLKNPMGAVIGLMPGAVALGLVGAYPTVRLNLDGTNFMSGTAKITKLSLKSEVKGGKTFTCSFRSKGAWVVPTV